MKIFICVLSLYTFLNFPASAENNSPIIKSPINIWNDTIETSIIIYIDSLSNYFIENQKITLPELEKELDHFKKNHKKVTIRLIVDKTVTIDKLLPVMDLCNKYDIKIRYETAEY